MEYVITLVHGTFARGADWVQEGSFLRKQLMLDLRGHSVSFCSFEWSGRNNFKARSVAAKQLERHLADAIRARPNAKHVIVAHSHGGNVALYALRNEALKSRVDAVVCLSTPFLHVRPRLLDEDTRDILAFAVGAFFLISEGIASLSLDLSNPELYERLFTSVPYLSFIVIIAVAVVPGVLVGLLLKRWNPYARRMSEELALPTLSRDFPLMVARVNGDEAMEGLD